MAERHLWRALRQSLPDHHWRKQVPFGAYIADFCSHGSKLIIELDGGQHAEAGAYDAARTRFLEAEGYRVVRFWNNDAAENLSGVLESIAATLSPSPSPSRGSAAHPSPAGRGREAHRAGRVRVTP